MFKKKTSQKAEKVIINEEVVDVGMLRAEASKAGTQFWVLLVVVSLLSSLVVPYLSMASIVMEGSKVFDGDVIPGYSMGGIDISAYGVDINSWGQSAQSSANKPQIVQSNYGYWNAKRAANASKNLLAATKSDNQSEKDYGDNKDGEYDTALGGFEVKDEMLGDETKARGWIGITRNNGEGNGLTDFASSPAGVDASGRESYSEAVAPYRTQQDWQYWDSQPVGGASPSVTATIYPDFVILGWDGKHATLLKNPDDIATLSANATQASGSKAINGTAAVPHYVPLSTLFSKFKYKGENLSDTVMHKEGGTMISLDTLLAAIDEDMKTETKDGVTTKYSPILDEIVQNKGNDAANDLMWGTHYENLNGNEDSKKNDPSSDAWNPYPYSMVFRSATDKGTVVSSIYNNNEAYVYFSPQSVYNNYMSMRSEYDSLITGTASQIVENDPGVAFQLGYYLAGMSILEAYLDESLPQDMTRGYVGPAEGNPRADASNVLTDKAKLNTRATTKDNVSTLFKTSLSGINDMKADDASGTGAKGFRSVAYSQLMYDFADAAIAKFGATGADVSLGTTSAVMNALSTYGYGSKDKGNLVNNESKSAGQGPNRGMTRIMNMSRVTSFGPSAKDASTLAVSLGEKEDPMRHPDSTATNNTGFYVPVYYPIQQHEMPTDPEMSYRFSLLSLIPYETLTYELGKNGFNSNVKLSYNTTDLQNLNATKQYYNKSGALVAQFDQLEDENSALSGFAAGNSIVINPQSTSQTVTTQSNVDYSSGLDITGRVDNALGAFQSGRMNADNVHDLVDIARAIPGVKYETFMRHFNPLKSAGGAYDFFLTRVSPAQTAYMPSLLTKGYESAGGLTNNKQIASTSIANFDYFSVPSFAPCFAGHTAEDTYYGALTYELRPFYAKGFLSGLPANSNIPALEAYEEAKEEMEEEESATSIDDMKKKIVTIYVLAKRAAFADAFSTLKNAQNGGEGSVNLGHLWNNGLESAIEPSMSQIKSSLKPQDNDKYDKASDDDKAVPIGDQKADSKDDKKDEKKDDKKDDKKSGTASAVASSITSLGQNVVGRLYQIDSGDYVASTTYQPSGQTTGYYSNGDGTATAVTYARTADGQLVPQASTRVLEGQGSMAAAASGKSARTSSSSSTGAGTANGAEEAAEASTTGEQVGSAEPQNGMPVINPVMSIEEAPATSGVTSGEYFDENGNVSSTVPSTLSSGSPSVPVTPNPSSTEQQPAEQPADQPESTPADSSRTGNPSSPSSSSSTSSPEESSSTGSGSEASTTEKETSYSVGSAASSVYGADGLKAKGYKQVSGDTWAATKHSAGDSITFHIKSGLKFDKDGGFDYVMQQFGSKHIVDDAALNEMSVWCKDSHGYAFVTNVKTIVAGLYMQSFQSYLQDGGSYFWGGAQAIAKIDGEIDAGDSKEEEKTQYNTVAAEYAKAADSGAAKQTLDEYCESAFEDANACLDNLRKLSDSLPKQMQNVLAWADYQSASESESAYLVDPSDANVTITIGTEKEKESEEVGTIRSYSDLQKAGFIIEEKDGKWSATPKQSDDTSSANPNSLQSRMVRGVQGTTYMATNQLAAYTISGTIARSDKLVTSNSSTASIPYSSIYTGVLSAGASRYTQMQAHSIDESSINSGLSGDLRNRNTSKAKIQTANPDTSSSTKEALESMSDLARETSASVIPASIDMMKTAQSVANTDTNETASKHLGSSTAQAGVLGFNAPVSAADKSTALGSSFDKVTMNRASAKTQHYDSSTRILSSPTSATASASMSSDMDDAMSLIDASSGNDLTGAYAVVQSIALLLVLAFLSVIAFQNFVGYTSGNEKDFVIAQTQFKTVFPRALIAVAMIGLPPMGGGVGFQGGCFLLLQLIHSIMDAVIGVLLPGNAFDTLMASFKSLAEADSSSGFALWDLITGAFDMLIGAICTGIFFIVGIVVSVVQVIQEVILFLFWFVGPIVWALYVWPYDGEGNSPNSKGLLGKAMTAVTGKLGSQSFTDGKVGNAAPAGWIFGYVSALFVIVKWNLLFWAGSLICQLLQGKTLMESMDSTISNASFLTATLDNVTNSNGSKALKMIIATATVCFIAYIMWKTLMSTSKGIARAAFSIAGQGMTAIKHGLPMAGKKAGQKLQSVTGDNINLAMSQTGKENAAEMLNKLGTALERGSNVGDVVLGNTAAGQDAGERLGRIAENLSRPVAERGDSHAFDNLVAVVDEVEPVYQTDENGNVLTDKKTGEKLVERNKDGSVKTRKTGEKRLQFTPAVQGAGELGMAGAKGVATLGAAAFTGMYLQREEAREDYWQHQLKQSRRDQLLLDQARACQGKDLDEERKNFESLRAAYRQQPETNSQALEEAKKFAPMMGISERALEQAMKYEAAPSLAGKETLGKVRDLDKCWDKAIADSKNDQFSNALKNADQITTRAEHAEASLAAVQARKEQLKAESKSVPSAVGEVFGSMADNIDNLGERNELGKSKVNAATKGVTRQAIGAMKQRMDDETTVADMAAGAEHIRRGEGIALGTNGTSIEKTKSGKKVAVSATHKSEMKTFMREANAAQALTAQGNDLIEAQLTSMANSGTALPQATVTVIAGKARQGADQAGTQLVVEREVNGKLVKHRLSGETLAQVGLGQRIGESYGQKGTEKIQRRVQRVSDEFAAFQQMSPEDQAKVSEARGLIGPAQDVTFDMFFMHSMMSSSDMVSQAAHVQERTDKALDGDVNPLAPKQLT